MVPSGHSVLVVEDDELLRLLVCDFLEENFTVSKVSNADEALVFLRTEGDVDLLFSDVHMAGSMNGIELARRVRDEFPLIRIVLTSGGVTRTELCQEFPFVPKPYQPQQLVTLLSAALNEQI